MRKSEKSILLIILFMVVFAVAFGYICRITVLAAPSPEVTEEATTEDHLSDEELDHILKVSQQFLDKHPELLEEAASPTDADFDTSPYMTYGLDEEWIDSTTTINSALNDIYRMILSIRNILLIFFFAFVIYWFEKMLHSIINRLFGRK